MKENNSKVPQIETSGNVALPFNEDQFKDFIVSLLGKPQTITKHLDGTFEIDKEQLISIYEVINRRIYQQNDAKLIQFRASIYYDDNTTVTLNGFEHLVNYNEKLPLISKAVHLTWQYLVKFRDKETFEKQEIALSFLTNFNGQIAGMDEFVPGRFRDSGINFRISHTGRTWGADIEAILTKHLKTIVQKESKFISFFRYNPDRIEYLVSTLLIGITFIFSFIKTKELKNIENPSAEPIFWIHHYGNYVFLFLGIYFLYKITILLLEEFEFYGAPSFVLLTPASEKERIKKLNSYRKKTIKYIGTFIISLIIGIATNYIYNYITT
jgi:hypothetical protein